ncbi:hypothetical protein LJR219_000325 [Phenylobacterium sp. LjRoot219]|uniref:hypothetical protein n=1 Tax=Phenylobacterium sp. LjRoot219 TaxID=3342283 RepID=UPI003ED01A3E
MHELVFHDPTGRRARRMRLLTGVLISLGALLVAAFFTTLAIAPRLPTVALKDPQTLQALHAETAHRLKGRQAWTKAPHPHSPVASGVAKPLSVGFYVSWDESSRESLADHIDQLDVVSPQWVQLGGGGGRVSITADPQARATIAAAKRPPSIMPGVFNARDGVWDGAAADALLAGPAAQQRLIATLAAQAQKRGFAGYVFDLESLSPASVQRYPAFLARARAALQASGWKVGDRAVRGRLAAAAHPGRRRRRGGDGLRPALRRRRSRPARRSGLVRDLAVARLRAARPGPHDRRARGLRCARSSPRTGRTWRCWCSTTARPTTPRGSSPRPSPASRGCGCGGSRTAARPGR